MSFGVTFVSGGTFSGTTTNPLTGAATGGAAAGTNFDGSAARTFDFSTLGAQPSTPRVDTQAAADITPDFTKDQYNRTGQNATLNFVNHTGTALAGFGVVARVKDNGTSRTIAWGTEYRGIGVTLPTATVVSKTLYIAMEWNQSDTKFDVLAVRQEA